jgi:hypothetical protein
MRCVLELVFLWRYSLFFKYYQKQGFFVDILVFLIKSS